jgi:hypothetical protein
MQINEAAYPISQMVETGLLGHTTNDSEENTRILAAYSSVEQTMWLGIGMFNFLIIVVMSSV